MRILMILVCIGVMITITGCFDDKGNYDYQNITIPDIDTTGLKTTYTVEQFKNLVIDPNITYDGDPENLAYEWLIYVRSFASNAPPSTAIASTKILDRTMAETPGTYIVELIVTDTKTDIKDNLKFTVSVESSVEAGWLVLHTHNGQSDVDFLLTRNAVPTVPTDKWMKNVYTAANGHPIPGEGRFITQTRNNSFYLNYINAGTSGSLVRASGADLYKVNDETNIFMRGNIPVNSQAHAYHGNYEAFITDGALYMINYQLSAVKSPATIGYYTPVSYGFKLAPFIPDMSSASSTTSTSSYNAGVFYDMDNRRFMRVPYTFAVFILTNFTTQPAGVFDINNIGKDILYMERAYLNYTYAFFKDTSGNGRWLYVADFYNADAGTVAKAAYNMTGLPDIENAKFFQCGDLGYVAYYATDNTIYTYDYYGANTAKIAYNAFSAGEVITSMKIYKPKTYNGLTDVNNRLLYVATWNEASQTAKVYEFAIDPTSGNITQQPLNVFEGFDGKIVDMCRKVKG